MKKVRNLQKLIPLLPLLLLAILFIFLPIISMVQKSFYHRKRVLLHSIITKQSLQIPFIR